MKFGTLTATLLLIVVLNGLTLHQQATTQTRKAMAKSTVRGNLTGEPYDWKYEGPGKLVRVSGGVSQFINNIQLHFTDGTSSPILGRQGGEPWSIEIPQDKLLIQVIAAVDSSGLSSVEFITLDGWRKIFGRLSNDKDEFHWSDFNGGKLVGLYGNINPKGYLNSIGYYVANKGVSYGSGIGNNYNWKDDSVGDLVKITGWTGDFLNGIQLHFSDGKSTPFIGVNEGSYFEINFDQNDPLKQVIFKQIAHSNLYSVEFVKESGQSLKVGTENDYEEHILLIEGRRIISMFGTTDYQQGYINNLGFDLA